MLSALRHRSFRLYFVAQVVSNSFTHPLDVSRSRINASQAGLWIGSPILVGSIGNPSPVISR